MTRFKVDSVDKQIQDNLSSSQIAEILNHLLFQALKPIMMETNLVECVLASLLNTIYSDHRRKLSTLPKSELVDLVFTILSTPDKDRKWELVKRLRLERSIWFNTIELFNRRCESYLRLEERYLRAKGDKKLKLSGRMHEIERSLSANRARLSAAIRWSEQAFQLYGKFRNSIVDKYIRLAQQEASKTTEDSVLLIDNKELFNNLAMSIGKAIDKFDPSQGTLTHYVNMWFMNAKTNPQYSHEYGRAYDVSTTKRRSISTAYSTGQSSATNLSVSLDSIAEFADETANVETLMIENANRSELFRLANRAPRSRISRLILGIPPMFSEQDRALFETVAV